MISSLASIAVFAIGVLAFTAPTLVLGVCSTLWLASWFARPRSIPRTASMVQLGMAAPAYSTPVA